MLIESSLVRKLVGVVPTRKRVSSQKPWLSFRRSRSRARRVGLKLVPAYLPNQLGTIRLRIIEAWHEAPFQLSYS